jgi:hypothetical protein
VARRLDDPWFQIAVLSAADQNSVEWLESALFEKRFAQANLSSRAEFLRQVASIIGAKQNEREVSKTITAVSGNSILEDERKILLEGLAEGLKRGSRPRIRIANAEQDKLLKLVESSPLLSGAAFNVASCFELPQSAQLRTLIKSASGIAQNKDGKSESRVAAIRILGLEPTHSTNTVLRELLVPQESEQVQMEVARALVASLDSLSLAILLERWPIYSGPVREVVLEGLLRQANHGKH